MKTDIGENRDGEKGIALIITLGILSILIVVALAFAASARTSRKAAATHASVTAARLIAESALAKVTGLIRYYNTHNGTINIQTLGSATQTSGVTVPADGKRDWLYRILSGTDDAIKQSNLDSNYPNLSWEYVVVDGKIRGRVAYTLEANSKVNPARIVDNSTKYPNAVGSPLVRDEKSDPQPRIGIDVNEMRLDDLPNISSYVSNLSDFNSTAASPAGQLTDDGDWSDIDYLCSKLGVSGTGKAKFKEDWFRTNAFEMKAAFWCDDDGDGKIEANGTAATGGTDNDDEMYCRFNLRRYVDNNGNGVYDAGDTNLWNDLNGDGSPYNDLADVNYLLQDPKRIDDPTAAPNDTGGIMWLSRWGKKKDGVTDMTGGISGWALHEINGDISIHNMKVRLAANIIDYCDNDDVPTSDADPLHWGENLDGTPWPTFFGHERTRYINEIMLAANPAFGVTTSGGQTTFDYQIDFYLAVETINMFRENVPDTDIRNTYGILDVTYTNPDGTTTSKQEILSYHVLSGISSDTGGPHFDFELKAIYIPNKTIATVTSPTVPGVTPSMEIRLEPFKTVLWQATSTKTPPTPPHAVDCINFYSNSHKFHKVTNGNWSECHIYMYDPKMKRTQIHWDDVGSTPPTLNPGNNPNANPTAGRYQKYLMDKDSTPVVVDSAAGHYVQSAFIRDDIMKSPWELGFIPRGYPFQTLNLAEFNDSDGKTNNTIFDNKHMRSGGNFYARNHWSYANCQQGGDANILSQIKMQPEMSRYGLVDINTKEKDILKLLLSRIRIGQTDLDDFTSDGTELTSAQVDQLANAIYNANGGYSHRAQVANALDTVMSSDPAFDTAAKREEVIGKFINLTSTASNEYRIIILAQTIKDVGGVTLSKDLNYDGKIDASGASDKYDADGDADTSDTIDETKPTALDTYDPMFDEITAEQKVAVDIAYDATTNEWQILKYEYMDD